VAFGSGRSTLEIFEEHYWLFNGVFMRVPGYMVDMIAALPEVFVVTPNVAFSAMYQLEHEQELSYVQEETVPYTDSYPMCELEYEQELSYVQEETVPYADFYPVDIIDAETQTSPFFVYENFMRTVREYLDLDYIHTTLGITGAGVRVAVVDLGIYHAHPEFERFLDETGRIRGWLLYNGVEHDNSPTCNHGTAVSGAVIGVAPGIELWHYNANNMSQVAAITAAHRGGANVISRSIGGDIPFSAESYAVNLAALSGVVMVSAAGNEQIFARPGDYFMLVNHAFLDIVVGGGYAGGVNAHLGDTLTSYSSHGPSSLTNHIKPDIIAPGGGVVTTWMTYVRYITSPGTSLSAPIVAGIAALLIEAFPNDTSYEIRARMMNTARPLADEQLNSVFTVGAGFVQPLYALRNETIVTVEHYEHAPGTSHVASELPQMASLSFGTVDLNSQECMNKTMPVRIRNTGDSTVTYTISYMFTRNSSGASSLSFSSTSVMVDSGGSGNFNVTMLIDNSAHTGFYEGYIYVRNGATIVARLPFGAAVIGGYLPTRVVRVYTSEQFNAAVQQSAFTHTIIEIAANINPNFSLYISNFSKVTIRSTDEYIHTLRNIFRLRTFIGNYSTLTFENINITSVGAHYYIMVAYGGHLRIMDGAILSGDTGMRVIIHGGTVTIYGGELSSSGDTSSAVHVGEGTFNMYGGWIGNSCYGGVTVLYDGIFNMYGGKISDNMRGGVSVARGGIFNMYGGEISGNNAVDGGGVFISSYGTFNMHGGKISGNNASNTGGGVFVADGRFGPFSMYGGEISGNTAVNGGGIGVGVMLLNLQHGFSIGPDAVFANNIASRAFNRRPTSDAWYYEHILSTQWSHSFTQGFNNFDIQYTYGTEIPPELPDIITTSLPNSVIGRAYNQSLIASSSSPVVWSIIEGNLPNGLILDTITGEITGIPLIGGTFDFTARATNIFGSTERSFSIFIFSTTPMVVTTGLRSMIALREDGTVWGWGSNQDGHLGGFVFSHVTPAQIQEVPNFTNIVSVATGNLHTVALKDDGTVWTLGSNRWGQLGDGTTTQRRFAAQLQNLSNVIAIAASNMHTVVLKDDGTVWAWGMNFNGQLGDGTTINRYIPTQVPNLTNVIAIATSGGHTVALKDDGTVWSWGSNSWGQLGDGTMAHEHVTPIQVQNLTNVIAIEAAGNYTIALRDDGTVWTWGANSHGQLGDGTTTNRRTPVQVQNLTNITVISAGINHAAALKDDGTVWVWGQNHNGQLGDGTTIDHHTPIQLLSLTNVIDISAGFYNTVALKHDGYVWTWGENGSGQIGDSTFISRHTPVQVLGSGGQGFLNLFAPRSPSITTLSLPDGITGTAYTQTLTATGTAPITWSITSGNLPNGLNLSTTGTITGIPSEEGIFEFTVRATNHLGSMELVLSISVFTPPPFLTTPMVTIHDRTTFALREDGTVWGWGSNQYGQLNDFIFSHLTPTRIQQVPNFTNIIYVTVGAFHTVALKEDNTVWTWGSNRWGQLGDGTTINRRYPVQLQSLTNVIEIAAGNNHTVILKEDGTVWAWGMNFFGQLGDGTTTDSHTPVQVQNLTNITAIATSVSHTLALRDDGTVWAWGNFNTTPVQVQNLTNIVAISAGFEYSVALRDDGTVWAWGSNQHGQLGNGTTAFSSTPTQVQNLTNITAISAGRYHTVALRDDGIAWIWGGNNNGQLGNGTTNNSPIPIQLEYLTNIIDISAGCFNTVVLIYDGYVWAWGESGNGQIGDNTFISRHTPAQVLGPGGQGFLNLFTN